MTQNRNRLIDLFIGNISNFIVHSILEIAIDNKDIANKYNKELTNSLEIAKRYREKINPSEATLQARDINYIKDKILNKVKAELLLRISNGYTNIDINLIEPLIDKTLKEMKVKD